MAWDRADLARRFALAVGLLIAAVSLGASPALADDPEHATTTTQGDIPADPDQAGEVITIYGEEEVARRRAILTEEIRSAGYLAGKHHGDHTVYRPEVPWKPTIVIQDEGLVELKRSPVRWMAPGKRENLLNNLWCLPPFSLMCVRIGGQLVSTTKLDYSKGRVMERINQPSQAWREAIANQANWDRVNDEVPRRIEATWREGAPVEPGGPELPTYADRRQALLNLWASRADNTEGAMVAAVVAEFLRQEVQQSAHPVTTAELAAANARAAPVRSLKLDQSGSSTIPPPATDLPASEPHNEAGKDPG